MSARLHRVHRRPVRCRPHCRAPCHRRLGGRHCRVIRHHRMEVAITTLHHRHLGGRHCRASSLRRLGSRYCRAQSHLQIRTTVISP